MKLIKAYIRYRKIDEVYKALKDAGFLSMTFVDCEGTGTYADQEEEHISTKYFFANAYRVIKLEILIEEKNVSKVVALIRQSGRTGYPGDGMILVSVIENVYKVRTDEEGIMSI